MTAKQRKDYEVFVAALKASQTGLTVKRVAARGVTKRKLDTSASRTKHACRSPGRGCSHSTILELWNYCDLWLEDRKCDYWRKFSCPKCGADGWESLTERESDDKRFGEEWVIEQGGECDHVPYDEYVLVTCQAVDVVENGKTVAVVEPDSYDPVDWLRYEYKRNGPDVDYRRPVAAFGTLFQSTTATTEESRALALAEGETN